MKKMFLLFCLFLIIGCTKSASDRSMLPNDANNVRDLGNGWATFDLNVDGTKKTFLFMVRDSTMAHILTQVK